MAASSTPWSTLNKVRRERRARSRRSWRPGTAARISSAGSPSTTTARPVSASSRGARARAPSSASLDVPEHAPSGVVVVVFVVNREPLQVVDEVRVVAHQGEDPVGVVAAKKPWSRSARAQRSSSWRPVRIWRSCRSSSPSQARCSGGGDTPRARFGIAVRRGGEQEDGQKYRRPNYRALNAAP